ncbi:M20/M25/M40 family metallo-hydrolase [Aminobacter anthyllidis]|uniref:M20/M25/M40 family metallo-hydrolase n=1 Tax=Aminobacter anthyllidis TaxID=1035067 RepID=UPI0024555CBE|nr:M20/M25/M40 family metallo-hydrolase [Aminobacter anthyllidis]MDH4985999.1 M20/M25/M40 family metallo-hydrolase [Aminobacter anthyllidis]
MKWTRSTWRRPRHIRGELVDRVEAGDSIDITRRGKTVARLTAATAPRKRVGANLLRSLARLDALVAAAEVVLLVERIAKSHASAVGTVGCLAVHPNSRNVVPGQVSMTVDLRHPEDDKLDVMEATFRQEIRARFDGRLTCSLTEIWRSPAVKFDSRCIDAVAAGAAAAGYSSLRLHSGAGHDSAYIARVAPTSMIFIPCLNGLSHNEAESSTKEQCQAGAQTLLNAVLSLDRTVGQLPSTQELHVCRNF